MEKVKTLAFYNSKGGIGKTTTVFHLSGILAERGEKVLVIDFDFQGNATNYLLMNTDIPQNTIYDVLVGKCEPSEATEKCLWQTRGNANPKYYGVDCMASSEKLEGEAWFGEVDTDLFAEKMNRFIEENGYTWVLLDMPPQNKAVEKICFHILADYVVTPLSCDTSSVSGLGKIVRKIAEAKKYNPRLEMLGAYLSNFKRQSWFNNVLLEKLEVDKNFIPIVIPHSEKIRVYSMEFGRPINFYKSKLIYTDVYRSFLDELINRMK